MPKYEKVEDLLRELNQHRRLFASLFERRMNAVSKEAVLAMFEGDAAMLERPEAYGLLVQTPGLLGLDPRLQEFLEEYMEVDETVHVLYIQENLDEIKKLTAYYLKDRKDRYLQRIKRHLRRITRVSSLNVKTLRDNLDETYKTESNFELKHEKLKDLRSQRDALEGVVKAVERVLGDDLFFRAASDEELLQIVHNLKVTLHEIRHNLIEIQHQIISYLNHIESRAAVVKKVLRLKTLKDKHYLKPLTDFYLRAGQTDDLPIAKNEPLRSRLSIDDLLEKQPMQELVLKVRERLRYQTDLVQNRAGDFSASAFAGNEEAEDRVNLHALRNVFLKRSGDLFSFVMEHPFTEPVDAAGRIGLYCQMVSRFTDELDFCDETGVHEGVEYALIYRRQRSKRVER